MACLAKSDPAEAKPSCALRADASLRGHKFFNHCRDSAFMSFLTVATESLTARCDPWRSFSSITQRRRGKKSADVITLEGRIYDRSRLSLISTQFLFRSIPTYLATARRAMAEVVPNHTATAAPRVYGAWRRGEHRIKNRVVRERNQDRSSSRNSPKAVSAPASSFASSTASPYAAAIARWICLK